MSEPFELGACEAVDLIRARKLSATELLQSCFRRIGELEGQIGAWVHLDPEKSFAAAAAVDERKDEGMLAGLPVGIKDLIDTADIPTSYGTEICHGSRPLADAACVTVCRRQGAVIPGKTVTQAFGLGAAVKTANPLNINHTAGGSSSGSVAAVAAKMVPLALGTQTASSVIRPASYTGLVGFVPSKNLLPLAGVRPLAGSFDNLGILARSVDDVELLWSSQLGLGFARGARPLERVKVGICRPSWLEKADSCARSAIDHAERTFVQAGADVVHVSLPGHFENLADVHTRIQEFEAARSCSYEFEHHREKLDGVVLGVLERGFAASPQHHIDLLAAAHRARSTFASVVGDLDCIVTAAAPGEAPKGWLALGDAFQSMGDPGQSRAWTLLHVPQVTIPCSSGENGLPIGIQLIGRYGSDQSLLRVARWAEDLFCDSSTFPKNLCSKGKPSCAA